MDDEEELAAKEMLRDLGLQSSVQFDISFVKEGARHASLADYAKQEQEMRDRIKLKLLIDEHFETVRNMSTLPG